ncbi:Cloroperoxidase [Gymnopus androsaceus JB14]|uniref:Cloroperoxidase n=1 Tax=Gymnopus androsaceus JB14 TaxID=1447944 RepID=A0A6A4HK67_9AGAR|nr:Cloroperoxidase [Gymnopus androsaceus JB14]
MLAARGLNNASFSDAYANAHPKRAATIPFDPATQYVSTTGVHEFVPPGEGDLRGPCPGLNAMANHGYIPHNGVATIDEFVDGTDQVFGMGFDLALFLSVYGTAMDGDLLTGTFSIGGPTAIGALLGENGLTGSHNNYEADVSPTRGDLYQYGNNYQVQLSQFQQLYDLDPTRSSYTVDLLTDYRRTRFQQSITNNPYFCNGPVSGIAVQPAAYLFIFHFMANKSAEYPEGLLNGDVLKSFYSITGPDENLVYTPGNERIPDNWYKNAIGFEYGLVQFVVDLNLIALANPQFLSIGCNTGTVNTFTPVDVADITGGVYNAQTLLEGNNLACFVLELVVMALPTPVGALVGLISQLLDAVNPILEQFTCPKLLEINESVLEQFPGWSGPGA